MIDTDSIRETLESAWAEIVEGVPFPGLDDDLLRSEAYESLVVLELVEALEAQLDIEIPDSALVPRSVGTIRRLLETIGRISGASS